MRESIIDTDIISFYFKGDLNVRVAFSDYIDFFDQINIPIITYYEIIAGLKHKDAKMQLKKFEDFVDSHNVLYVSKKSARVSGEIFSNLKKRGVSVGASDLLIAGIAITHDLTLITNNEKDFKFIPGLRIKNWKKN